MVAVGKNLSLLSPSGLAIKIFFIVCFWVSRRRFFARVREEKADQKDEVK